MHHDFYVFPLTGNDLLPPHREVTFLVYLAQQSKAELDSTVKMRIDAAQTPITVVNEQNPGHGMKDPVLESLFLKLRIRFEGNPSTVIFGSFNTEDIELGNLLQEVPQPKLVFSESLTLAAKLVGVINQIGHAFFFCRLRSGGERFAVDSQETAHSSVCCFRDQLLPEVAARPHRTFFTAIQKVLALVSGGALGLFHLLYQLIGSQRLRLLRRQLREAQQYKEKCGSLFKPRSAADSYPLSQVQTSLLHRSGKLFDKNNVEIDILVYPQDKRAWTCPSPLYARDPEQGFRCTALAIKVNLHRSDQIVGLVALTLHSRELRGYRQNPDLAV
jgi:hypothetical protein